MFCQPNLSLKSKLSFHIPPELQIFSLRQPFSNSARVQLRNAQDYIKSPITKQKSLIDPPSPYNKGIC